MELRNVAFCTGIAPGNWGKMMQVEGEPSKRFKLAYWGVFIGSYETAKEAVAKLDEHDKLMRPVIDRGNEGRYVVRDGRKEITIGDLRKAAKAEVE